MIIPSFSVGWLPTLILGRVPLDFLQIVFLLSQEDTLFQFFNLFSTVWFLKTLQAICISAFCQFYPFCGLRQIIVSLFPNLEWWTIIIQPDHCSQRETKTRLVNSYQKKDKLKHFLSFIGYYIPIFQAFCRHFLGSSDAHGRVPRLWCSQADAEEGPGVTQLCGKWCKKVMASFRKHLFSHTGICIYIYMHIWNICMYSMYTVCIQYVCQWGFSPSCKWRRTDTLELKQLTSGSLT